MADGFHSEEGYDAEVRRLLSICVEKASKPIPPNLDKPAHDKELQMKGGCTHIALTRRGYVGELCC